MWWWRKIRKANISGDLRTQLEVYGEAIIAQALATSTLAQYSGPLGFLQTNSAGALEWLTERRDLDEHREDRLETVEWAILVFVIIGVLADCLIVARELGWLKPD